MNPSEPSGSSHIPKAHQLANKPLACEPLGNLSDSNYRIKRNVGDSGEGTGAPLVPLFIRKEVCQHWMRYVGPQIVLRLCKLSFADV